MAILKYKKSKMITDLDILEAEGIIKDIVCNEDEEIAYGLETIKEMEELFS